MSKKVLIAMSGGVDSSAAAVCLKNEGYECLGATMLMQDAGENGIADARAVANALDMDFSVLDAREMFKKEVMDQFVAAYLRGETPNPCIVCNKKLKFGLFDDYAKQLGADYIATGHYARVGKCGDRFLIKKGLDEKKDQSYVLYNMTQDVLSRLLLPLGGMSKAEVRELAIEAALKNAEKKESQDICFVPDGDYAAFIRRTTGTDFPKGDFVDTDGKVLGTHKGIIHYTIGQRRGLGLALPAPLYVFRKDLEGNRVILSPEALLFSKHLDAKDVNLIPFDRLEKPIRVKAKVRYKQGAQWATVTATGESTVHVEFDEPQRAFAKGQAVVFYDGDYVVGGGTII